MSETVGQIVRAQIPQHHGPATIPAVDLKLIEHYASMSMSDPRLAATTLASKDGRRILETAWRILNHEVDLSHL